MKNNENENVDQIYYEYKQKYIQVSTYFGIIEKVFFLAVMLV